MADILDRQKATPAQEAESLPDRWRIILVEDEPDIRAQVKEFLSGEVIQGIPIEVVEIGRFDDALEEIRRRQVDLLILDVFQGSALAGGREAGIELLRALQSTGFVAVVLYTAHPEKVEEHRTHFVRLVGKDVNGLEQLRDQIRELFDLRIPLIHRAVVTHMDRVLRDYMWGFVQKHWDVFQPIAAKPEFLYILLQRLAASFASDRVEGVVRLVFGAEAVRDVVEDTVHPAEQYIMPPLTPGVGQLGDVRVRTGDNGTAEHLVILWPSCDMVRTAARLPKTDRVHCAVATRLDDTTEFRACKEAPSKRKRDAVEAILSNMRAASPDRYHAIAGLCDLPDLLLDFQRIEILSLEQVVALECKATLASPYAEALSGRYVRYLGRLGTPDIDAEYVLKRMGLDPL